MQAWETVTDWFSGAANTASTAFNSAKNTLNTAINTLGSQAQEWSVEWQAAVDNLKAKAQEFARVFSGLQSDASNVPPELKAQYDALMSRGQWVKNQIQSITSGIDFGFNMFSSTPLMHGLQKMGGMNALGILPLVPIAIIVGGVAVIVAWLADAYSMQQKINIAKASKANPNEIAKILGAGSGTSANFFQAAGVMLLIGVGVMLLMPTIQKALKK